MEIDEARKLLPEDDIEFLIEKGIAFDLVRVGGDLHFIYQKYELPDAYEPRAVDLRIILPAGWPNARPDMFWTKPWVKLTGTPTDPVNCSHPMTFPPETETWQRWSRHHQGEWRPGIDCLRTYLAIIRSELQLRR